MKPFAFLVSIFLYTIGDILSRVMLRHDIVFLYKWYNWCMVASLYINERYKLTVWTKP